MRGREGGRERERGRGREMSEREFYLASHSPGGLLPDRSLRDPEVAQ